MIIEGNIIKVAGPVILADGMRGTQMHEMVKVGDDKLIGEIIELEGDTATIQVYEETAGIKPGEKVESTGGPLSVELGPGIMGSIYDGIQRPLDVIKQLTGDYIARGIDVPSIDKEKKWDFKPVAKEGDKLITGDTLGEVQETSAVLHKILLPPTIESGTVKSIKSGQFTVEEVIAEIEKSIPNADNVVLADLRYGNDDFKPFQNAKRLLLLKSGNGWGNKTYLTHNGMGSHFSNKGKQSDLKIIGYFDSEEFIFVR